MKKHTFGIIYTWGWRQRQRRFGVQSTCPLCGLWYTAKVHRRNR